MQGRVTRRFVRAGSRDGRRRRSAAPTSEYLTAAVEVATSRVLEDHLSKEAPLRATVAALHQALADPVATVDALARLASAEEELEHLLDTTAQQLATVGAPGSCCGRVTASGTCAARRGTRTPRQ